MKNGKAPTRKQKDILRAHGLRSENWLIVKDLPDTMEVVSRASLRKLYGRKRTRIITKD